MTASQGVETFLLGPARAGRLSCDAAEEAIDLASTYAPSSAFDRAQQWWQRCGTSNQWSALGFAKGVRWLAMLRRDGDTKIFDTVCHQLLLIVRLP